LHFRFFPDIFIPEMAWSSEAYNCSQLSHLPCVPLCLLLYTSKTHFYTDKLTVIMLFFLCFTLLSPFAENYSLTIFLK
jgi:hypothetical protein